MTGACDWVHAGGQLRRVTDMAILATDRGFLFGDAVYTVVKVRDSHPVFLGRHVGRLEHYLVRLGSGPASGLASAVAMAIEQVVDANELVDGRVRVTLSRSTSPGDDPDVAGVALVATAYPAAPDQLMLKAVTCPDGRGDLRDLKTVNRLVATVALNAAIERGADEAIFSEAGQLVEGTCHNLIAWDGDRLMTPDLTRRGVAGVVREVLMERLPIVIAEQPADGDVALYLTNSITGVAAVDRLDGRKLPRDDDLHARLRTTLRELEDDDVRAQQSAGGTRRA